MTGQPRGKKTSNSSDVIKEIEEEFKARSMGLEDSQELVTISEAADMLGMSEREVTRLVLLKSIPAVKVGSRLRLRKKDVEQYIDRLVKTKAKEPGEAPVLYSAEQVAEILQLSLDNVWKLLKEGRLKGFKIRGGRSSWRVPAEALEEFISSKLSGKGGS